MIGIILDGKIIWIEKRQQMQKNLRNRTHLGKKISGNKNHDDNVMSSMVSIQNSRQHFFVFYSFPVHFSAVGTV